MKAKNIEFGYYQNYCAHLKLKNYSRHRFITKTILRGVGATVIISACRITRSMSTLYTIRCPGADTQARRNDQADQQSLHVA